MEFNKVCCKIRYRLNHCQTNRSGTNITQLQSCVNELQTAFTSVDFFADLDFIDIITSLLCHIQDASCDITLRETCLDVIYNLVQNKAYRLILFRDFGIISVLAAGLLSQPGDNMQLTIYRTLQAASLASTPLDPQNPPVTSLLHSLVSSGLGEESPELREVMLAVLANLCRHPEVQTFVKGMRNYHDFKTHLFRSLSETNVSHNHVVYVMSITFHLISNDERFFSRRNIQQTLQVLFNTLLNGDLGWGSLYAADLLIQLCQSNHMKTLVKDFPYLNSCIKQMLTQISGKHTDLIHKILDLLLTLCKTREHRHLIAQSFLQSEAAVVEPSSDVTELRQQNGSSSSLAGSSDNRLGGSVVRREPVLTLLALCEAEGELGVAAIDLLREIYQDLFQTGSHTSTVPTPLLNLVSPLLHRQLLHLSSAISHTSSTTPSPSSSSSSSSSSPHHLSSHLQRAISLVSLMTTLLDGRDWHHRLLSGGGCTAREGEGTGSPPSSPSLVDLCQILVTGQLETHRVALTLTLPSDLLESNLVVSLSAELIVRLLYLYYRATELDSSSPLATPLQSLLEHPHTPALLAFLLISPAISREVLQTVMTLHATAISLDGFSNTEFGDCIYTLFRQLPSFSTAPVAATANPPESGSVGPLQPSSPLKRAALRTLDQQQQQENQDPAATGPEGQLSAGVDRLIESWQSGMKLSDIQKSDMFNIYEHKIEGLQTRDQHLEGLLASTKSSYRHTEALLSRSRCRLVASDTQNRQLRGLVVRSQAAIEEKDTELGRRGALLLQSQKKLEKNSAELQQKKEQCQELNTTGKKLQEKVRKLSQKNQEMDLAIDNYRSRLDSAETMIKSQTQQIEKYSQIAKMMSDLRKD